MKEGQEIIESKHQNIEIAPVEENANINIPQSIIPTDVQQSMKSLDEDLYSQVITSPLFQEVRKARGNEKLSTEEYNVLMAAIISAQKREQTLVSLLNRSFVTMILDLKEGIIKGIRKPIFHSPSYSKSNIGDEKNNEKESSKGILGVINGVVNLQNIAIIIAFLLVGFSAYQKVQRESLTNTISALKGNIEAFESEKKRLRTKITDEEKKITEVNKKFAGLDAEFSDLQLKSQVETQKFNLIVVNLEKNIEEKNTLIKELKHGTKETSDVLQSQVTSLEKMLKEEQKNYSTLSDKYTKTLAKSKQLEERVTARTNELNRRNSELNITSEKLEQLYDIAEDMRRYKTRYAMSIRAVKDIESYLPGWFAEKPKPAQKVKERIQQLYATIKEVKIKE